MTEKQELIAEVEKLKIFSGDFENLNMEQLQELIDKSKEIPGSETQVQQLNSRIEDLELQLHISQENLDKANSTEQSMQENIDNLIEKNEDLRTSLTEANEKISQLESEEIAEDSNDVNHERTVELRRFRQAQIQLKEDIAAVSANLTRIVKNL